MDFAAPGWRFVVRAVQRPGVHKHEGSSTENGDSFLKTKATNLGRPGARECQVSKNDELCIKTEESCIKNEELCRRINRSNMPFPQRENIKAVIDAVRAIGVAERDNFDTSDLFEARNPRQVWICILALGRAAYGIEGYQGPCVGKVEKGNCARDPHHNPHHNRHHNPHHNRQYLEVSLLRG